MNTFDGYIRRNGTNSKVLLDGGNAKALSEFIGTISYANNKITYTKADGTSYDLVDLSNYIYNLGAATSDNLGGIRIGFSQSGKNYPVQLDLNNKAYVYVPWEENSHYTTRLYVGDGTAENKVTTNGNTRITVTDNNNVRNYITLIGSGATNISSDDNGKITINSTNTTYNTGDSATLNKGTNTEGKLWSAKTLVDYISDILGVDSTAITSLNTLIGQLHDNDTATGILVELAKKLNTPSSSIGSNNQPIYWNGSSFTTIGYTIEKSVPSNAIFTDTKYSFYVGENNNIKEHKNVSNPYFKLFENNTPTSIQIKAGTGISVTSDANGNITIKNESPDQNHNTWRPIKIEGTEKLGSAINTDALNLTAGNGIEISYDSTNKKVIIKNTKPDQNHDTHYTTSMYIGENNDTKVNKAVNSPYFKLFDNDTRRSTLRFVAGSGIGIASDDSGNITITNSSPDQNHNTDKTGIKLGTISGTKKTDSTVIINNSSTGLTIAGGTNKFSIGDGTNYIEIPITPSFTVSNKDSTIGTSLTTIATIAGTDIKAKIDSYLPLSGGTITGDIVLHDNVAFIWSPNFSNYIRMPFMIEDDNYFTGINLYHSRGIVYTKLGIFTDKYGHGNDTNSIFLYPDSSPKIGTNTMYHSGNLSVSKSGETLTVNIGGTSYSLTNTNTWRGITDSYSGTDSTISLSQKGGNDLYNTLLNGYANSAGNADMVDNYHAFDIGKAGWVKVGAQYPKKYYKIATISLNGTWAATFIIDTSGDFNYCNYAHGKLTISCYEGSTFSVTLLSGPDYEEAIYAYIDSSFNVWLAHDNLYAGFLRWKCIFNNAGNNLTLYTNNITSQQTEPSSYKITSNGAYHYWKSNNTFCYNGKMYSDNNNASYPIIRNVNLQGNATYANYLNLVAGNEIRFNKIPSSSTDVYFNYFWAGGIADDKINNYRFFNGNRGYAGIIAEQLSCTNGYIYLHGPGSSTYDLSSISSNSSGLTIETPRATNAQNGTVLPLMVKTRGGQWGELQTGTITANKFNSGILELYPNDNNNYAEGIRIHSASNGWTTLIFCGTDNTGTSGTSANSWSLHTNNGNFYINRNDSNGAKVNRLWGHSNGYTIGNTTESGYNFTVGGTSRLIGTTTTSHILPASDYTYNIGSNTAEYANTFSRAVFARHLNACGPYSNDKDLYLGYSSTTNILFYVTDINGNNRKKVAQFKQDGNAVFDNTVTASSFYSSSDIRLKNIISDIQYSSEEIASLSSVKYTWKNKNKKVHIGSIAQDVERIIPEVVNTDNEGYKSIDYATLGAIGVISLAREIVELKKEIKELKSKLYG